MKTYHAFLLTLGALGTIGIVNHAGASGVSQMYASTSAGGPGELYLINALTGATMQDIGPLNDSLANNYAVTGLAFDPLNGVLYGSTGNKSGTSLLTINPSSGAVTVIGSFSAAGAGTMADIAFDSSGHLFGISSSGGANLYSINLGTGAATQVGPSGVSFTQGGGLAISPGGIFYGSPTATQFGTYDPITGAFTLINAPATPAGSGTSYAALAFNGATLYGDNLGTPPQLVTLDASGNVTDIGPMTNSIDAIAFKPVPEPSTIALMSAGALALFAAARRKK